MVGGIDDSSGVSEAMARLLALAPPPRSVAPQRVEAAERRLGLTLPPSWREVVQRYGDGTFDGWLTVFGPARVIAETVEFAATRAPLDPPFALHPAPRGLIVWGFAEPDVALCWESDGPPDGWPVVAIDRELRTDRFARPTAGFVASAVAGDLESMLLEPDADHAGRHTFLNGP